MHALKSVLRVAVALCTECRDEKRVGSSRDVDVAMRLNVLPRLLVAADRETGEALQRGRKFRQLVRIVFGCRSL